MWWDCQSHWFGACCGRQESFSADRDYVSLSRTGVSAPHELLRFLFVAFVAFFYGGLEILYAFA